MQKIRFSELSEDVRGFVSAALEQGGLVVEDDTGNPQVSVNSLRFPSEEEKQRADVALKRLREKTGQAMKEAKVSEDDVIEEILKDD